MRIFTTIMNMSPPLFLQSYSVIIKSLSNIYEKAAKESMLAAANDLQEKSNVSMDENLKH